MSRRDDPVGRHADWCGQEGEGKQGSPGTGIKVSWSLIYIFVIVLVNVIVLVVVFVIVLVTVFVIVMITRLARVKEEMGDKEGAEDLRQEAFEMYLKVL